MALSRNPGRGVCGHVSKHRSRRALTAQGAKGISRQAAAAILSWQQLRCSLLQIHAEKSPYLTEKLRIFMLPTLALVKNQKVDSYVVGFDELGGKDDFSTEVLAGRLEQAALLWPSGGLDGVALQHKTSEGDQQQQPMSTLQGVGGA